MNGEVLEWGGKKKGREHEGVITKQAQCLTMAIKRW